MQCNCKGTYEVWLWFTDLTYTFKNPDMKEVSRDKLLT